MCTFTQREKNHNIEAPSCHHVWEGGRSHAYIRTVVQTGDIKAVEVIEFRAGSFVLPSFRHSNTWESDGENVLTEDI